MDYGELYTRTHRHRDGTPISEAAEEIIVSYNLIELIG